MKKIILAIIGFLFGLVILVLGLVETSMAPVENARRSAVQMVSEFNVLKSVDQFFWYRGQTQTYTLYGANQNGQNVYVVINVNDNTGAVYGEDEIQSIAMITSKVKALYPNAKINEPTIGIDKQVLIWEVTYTQNGQYSYIIFDAKTGQVLHEIKNATNE